MTSLILCSSLRTPFTASDPRRCSASSSFSSSRTCIRVDSISFIVFIDKMLFWICFVVIWIHYPCFQFLELLLSPLQGQVLGLIKSMLQVLHRHLHVLLHPLQMSAGVLLLLQLLSHHGGLEHGIQRWAVFGFLTSWNTQKTDKELLRQWWPSWLSPQRSWQLGRYHPSRPESETDQTPTSCDCWGGWCSVRD